MSVHRLKDGRWIVKYYDGSKSARREYFGRGIEAEQKAHKRNLELVKPRKIKLPVTPTFGKITDAYMKSKVSTMSRSTYKKLIYTLKIILSEIGLTQAGRLTHYRLDQYTQKRLRKVRPTTVHGEITYIQAILNWAVKRELIVENPLKNYEKPKRDDTVFLPPNNDEIRQILNHSPPHLQKALIVSYFCGIRPGYETLSLKYENVDFKNEVILIGSARKKGPRFRTIPLHPEFLGLLKKWKKEDKNEYIITWYGKPIKSIKKAFASAKTKAGITRKLRLYDFRHAAITAMLTDGADLKSVSEIAGHSRPDTTTKVYQHTSTNTHKKAIKRLPSLGNY